MDNPGAPPRARARRTALPCADDFDCWLEQDDELVSDKPLLVPCSTVQTQHRADGITEYSGALRLEPALCRGNRRAEYARDGMYEFAFELAWATGDTHAERAAFARMYRVLRSRHGITPSVPVDDDAGEEK
jgi:hypothetical protein